MIWETLANIPAGQLTAFIAGGLVLNFAPGQDVFFASACGIQGGPRAGAWAGFGVGLGVGMGASLGIAESLVIMRGATARSGAAVRRMGHT